MVLICAICSESIEKSPALNTEGPQDARLLRGKSNLSAAECGHIFHTFCITKWTISGAATSNQCPNCRKLLTKKFVDLFPDAYDEKPGDPDSPGPSTSKFHCCTHEAEFSQLKSKLHTVEADFKIQVNMYELLTVDRQQLQTQFHQEQRDREALETQLGQQHRVLSAECEKYKQLAATKDGECRLMEYQLTKYKTELEAEKRRAAEERRETDKIQAKVQAFLQRKQEEIKSHYMELAAFNLEFDIRNIEGSRRLDPIPSTSREAYKSPLFKSKPQRGKKMVYEKCFDGILDTESEDEAILIGADTRKRCKKPMILPRSSESSSGGASKPKKNKFSSELSMSPITLSSDTDADVEDDPDDIQAIVMDEA